MSNELHVAIEAARKAGGHALSYYNKTVQITVKPDNSLVSKVDKECEAIIKKHIQSVYKDAKFVGEETGGDSGEKKFWLIDPIDGTYEFLHGIPLWGCLVSLIENQKAIIGVAYIPVVDEMYYAEKEQGAFLNGERIHVSKVDSLASVRMHHCSMKHFGNRIHNLYKLSQQVFATRGNDMYGHCLVAKGKAEVSLCPHLFPWDMAGFKLIIEEAGGKVTNLQGVNWKITDANCVATNGLLHDDVIRILNEKN